jgi:hypothetical protein
MPGGTFGSATAALPTGPLPWLILKKLEKRKTRLPGFSCSDSFIYHNLYAVAKKKLIHFAENLTFPHLFQPTHKNLQAGFH